MATYFEMSGRCEAGDVMSWVVEGVPDSDGLHAPRPLDELAQVGIVRSWEEEEEAASQRQPDFLTDGIQVGDTVSVNTSEGHVVVGVVTEASYPNANNVIIPESVMVDAAGRLMLIGQDGFHQIRQAPPPRIQRLMPTAPGQRVDFPLFELASNPTIQLSDIRHRRFDLGLDRGRVSVQVPAEIKADLSGSVWHLVPRWTPLTEQKAREGLVRLLSRRMHTQPKAWFERLDDDPFT